MINTKYIHLIWQTVNTKHCKEGTSSMFLSFCKLIFLSVCLCFYSYHSLLSFIFSFFPLALFCSTIVICIRVSKSKWYQLYYNVNLYWNCWWKVVFQLHESEHRPLTSHTWLHKLEQVTGFNATNILLLLLFLTT